MAELTGKDFWDRVFIEQYKLKMTDVALSEVSGIPYGTIHTQKSRKSLPKADILLALSKALDVSSDFLLTGEGEVLCAEAQAVQDDPELRALVRAISRDRRLLAAISAVVESYESKADIG